MSALRLLTSCGCNEEECEQCEAREELRQLLDAGRAMAEALECNIEACGNSPPPCAGCPGCQCDRDALAAWVAAETTVDP